MEKETNLTISIGGIAVGLHSDQVNVREQYSRYYGAFISGVTPITELELNILGREETWNQEFLLDNGIVLLNTPAVVGKIDCNKQKNVVTINSSSLFETVDYMLRVVFAVLLFREGGLLLHAAGLKKNGNGYLFTGHSGTGKSTVARLSGDALVLNDDLVTLLPSKLGWVVHGTPFWNPTQTKPNPCSALLKGIYALVQDEQVFIEQLSHGMALAELITNVPVLTQDPGLSGQVMERCSEIIKRVTPVRLHFFPDDSFWRLID